MTRIATLMMGQVGYGGALTFAYLSGRIGHGFLLATVLVAHSRIYWI